MAHRTKVATWRNTIEARKADQAYLFVDYYNIEGFTGGGGLRLTSSVWAVDANLN